MFSSPVFADGSEGHAAESVPRGRVDEGQVEVADDDHDRDVHERVVEVDGAGESEARVALAVPEQQARDEEQRRECCGQDCVDLLAGVEAALGAVDVAGEEAAVVAVEQVDLAERSARRARRLPSTAIRRMAPAQEIPVQKWMSLISGRLATAAESDGR